jgi:hypothetical protein
MYDAKDMKVSKELLRGFSSDDPVQQKTAAQNSTEYLRRWTNTYGTARQILTPYNVQPSELQKTTETAKPALIKEMQPWSNSAFSVPLGTPTPSEWLGIPRYAIVFQRLYTKRYYADMADLLTVSMPIQQVFSDLMLKEILGEEDRKFIATLNYLAGTLNATTGDYVDDTDSCGYVTLGAFSRQAWTDAGKALLGSNRHLNTEMALVNAVTHRDLLALERNEIGGDYAEELFVNGISKGQIMGIKVAQTLNTDLVLNNLVYLFANEMYLGDFCVLEDVTLSTEKRDFWFTMWAYELVGSMISNRGGFAIGSFTGTFNGWTPAEIGSST